MNEENNENKLHMCWELARADVPIISFFLRPANETFKPNVVSISYAKQKCVYDVTVKKYNCYLEVIS